MPTTLVPTVPCPLLPFPSDRSRALHCLIPASTLQIRWYLDGYNYYTAYSAAISPPGSGWYTTAQGAGPNAPFDLPFYLILNLAVGGPQTVFTGGAPLGTTLNQPQQLFVDWVRVHGLPWALSQHQ